jgi:hypothetical protein
MLSGPRKMEEDLLSPTYLSEAFHNESLVVPNAEIVKLFSFQIIFAEYLNKEK